MGGPVVLEDQGVKGGQEAREGGSAMRPTALTAAITEKAATGGQEETAAMAGLEDRVPTEWGWPCTNIRVANLCF